MLKLKYDSPAPASPRRTSASPRRTSASPAPASPRRTSASPVPASPVTSRKASTKKKKKVTAKPKPEPTKEELYGDEGRRKAYLKARKEMRRERPLVKQVKGAVREHLNYLQERNHLSYV